jgi:uncharacterized repeat protein (TIGR01451 family)
MISTARARCVVAACGPVALALLATAASAQAPEPDCVDNQRLPIAAGGTNGVHSVFAIDVDGDGDVDVLAASVNDDKIAWYENDGNTPPSFTEHVVTTNADGAASVHAGDLDGDGDVDVASASGTDNKIAWYENDGSDPPRFIERGIANSAQNAAAVHIADVDGDGDNDVVGASNGDDTIALYENDLAQKDPGDTSAPVFTQVVLSDSADGAASVFAAEILADPTNDYLEVLSASRLDDTIAWYERAIIVDDEGDDIVIWVKRIVDSNADGATSVYASDLDGDGHVDVLSASGNDNKIAWYESDGADPPSFTKHVIFADASGASAVFAIDLDGDLDVDVLSASRFDDKIAWYENLGGGNFGDPTGNQQIVTADAPGAAAVYAIDLDGDVAGDVDVLSASSVAGAIASNDKIAWHENDGQPAPAFTEHEISGGAVAPEAVLAVDVDDDTTDVDVLAASSVDDTIVWFESDGMNPPSFTKHLVSTDAPGALDLFWADLDGDLDMDVVAALAGADSIAWYENLGGGDFGNPATNRKNISLLTADGASSVFAVDLDDDSDIDVLSASADDDRIAWYENLGGGDFGDPVNNQRIISDLADGASSVYAVDLDGDSDVDVIAASVNDDRIRWFESDLKDDPGPVTPPPNFTTHFVSDSENGARDVVAADMDDDGDLDIVSAASLDDRVSWFEQRVNDEAPQIGILVPGASVDCTATYTITQADMDNGSLANTGTSTAGTVSDSDTLTVALGSPSSSIDIAKSSDATASTGAGDTIVYSYAVGNDGDVTLTDVSVTDPQAGLSGINCGAGTTQPQIASLDPDATVICTATYTVTQADVDGGSITNTGTATAGAVSDSDELTVTFASPSSIDIAKSSDATESMDVGDTITYTYRVTNNGEVTLSNVSVSDPQVGLSTLDCGIDFFRRIVTGSAVRVRAVLATDVDADGDTDMVSTSSGDDTIEWYQSDLAQQVPPDPPTGDPLVPRFERRKISTTSESARAVAVADINGDGALDVVTGFLFEIAWHAGNAAEACYGFDATGDNEVDGAELSLLGGAFGQICADPGAPNEWWLDIDYNGDCLVDGEDLAILTAFGVWGRSTDPDDTERAVCAFTCP